MILFRIISLLQSEVILKEDVLNSNIFLYHFVFVLLLSSIHSLSGQIMDISVERKWVPCIIKRDLLLDKVNTKMRQIDLATEVLAPFIVGLISKDPSIYSFLIIGVLNFLSFIPQYFLLYLVYEISAKENFNIDMDIQHQQKQQHHDNISRKEKFKFFGEWNPLTNLLNGWTLFRQTKVFWIVMAYSSLWLTILSPHDPIFNAYLSLKGYSYIELSVFRGVGAVFGLLSTLSFKYVLKWCHNNLEKTCFYYIGQEGLMVILSGLVFSFADITNNTTSKYMFMMFIILSRLGLYGFEVGEIHFVQRGVDDHIRGIVSGVESSLTSLASLTVFMVTIAMGDPQLFSILVWLSILFINIGVILTFSFYNK